MNQIKSRIKSIISKQLGINIKDISNDLNFSNDMGADSLDIIELMMELEKEFNIDIPDEIVERINSVNTAIKHINDLIKQANI